MTVYIDITQLDRGRANTGIQRVVKEFLQRTIQNHDLVTYKILSYDSNIEKMQVLSNKEIKKFLLDISSYKFKERKTIEIENIYPAETTIFFDIDSAWNAPYKREKLYPILKKNGFLIYNFIHDLIPVLLPELVHDLTVTNYNTFIKNVYTYSDMVLFNSASSQNDFITYKNTLNIQRYIATRVVGLGSDFIQYKTKIENNHIKTLLKKKFILFVGTIEPRKNQETLLDAFEVLAEKYNDLNLILIGKKGWKIDDFIHRVKKHYLLGKQLFWLNDIDDNTLIHFYQNAFIVAYLSKYEGYGLPIAESLQYNNITIASKNSSMYEVGRDAADYIEYNSLNEITDIISLYYNNKKLYEEKKKYISKNFKALSWDQFAQSIFDIFNNIDKSISLRRNHLEKLQFVFISIEIENIKDTIKSIDTYVDFVKEYIIITAPHLVQVFEQIKTKYKLIVIDETTILKKYAKDFQKRDHVSKNWLLRTSMLNLDILDKEFIMLDDDNRPLKKVSIDKFIDKQGCYNIYYFYNLLDWHHKGTDYDIGQQNMKIFLTKYNYELLSYSSHAPQIINKSIFKEVIEEFFELGLTTAIDEWSIYFNYAVSKYPSLFNKKLFETINWPESPIYWDCDFNTQNITFENYYKSIYHSKFFDNKDTIEEKIQKKKIQLEPFIQTKNIFEKNKDILSSNNLVHGVLEFKNTDLEFYLFNIPYYFIIEQGGNLRLRLNYKFLNKTSQKQDLEIVIFYNQRAKVIKKLVELNSSTYQESIVEFPIISQGLQDGIYDLTLNLRINQKPFFQNDSPYLMKLIVKKDIDYMECLENPSIIETKEIKVLTMRDKIKKLPFLGWLLRWFNNLLRLNNIKHNLFININRTTEHQKQIQQLRKTIELQSKEIEELSQKMNSKVETEVAKEISTQSDSFQQRLDQFIHDTKIDLKLKNDKNK